MPSKEIINETIAPKMRILKTVFISIILNLPPTYMKYLCQKTAPQASQIFLHKVQSTRQQESLAWRKYRISLLERLMHTSPLPAEGILGQVAGLSHVERQNFRIDDTDTGNSGLLN